MPKKTHAVDIDQQVHETQSPNQQRKNFTREYLKSEYDTTAILSAQLELLRKLACSVANEIRSQQKEG